MAKQSGIIKLQGTIGDISFYKSSAGYLARSKGGVDKDRIESDDAFARTRENGAEFGRAGIAGRVLRTAFKLLLQNTADSLVTSRLTKLMLKVIQADAVDARGERTVMNGDLSLLEGFEFNVSASLASTLYVNFTPSIDRTSGVAAVSVEAFTPEDSIVAPTGATHCALKAAAAEIDFETETFTMKSASSGKIELGSEEQAAQDLSCALTAESDLPMVLIFGIEFYQQVNDAYYSLKNGSSNALTCVAVDMPEEEAAEGEEEEAEEEEEAAEE